MPTLPTSMGIWQAFVFGIITFLLGLGYAPECRKELEKEAKAKADRIAIEKMENENKELINKALKHYAETKGINQ